MPKWLQVIAVINPLSYVVEILRCILASVYMNMLLHVGLLIGMVSLRGNSNTALSRLAKNKNLILRKNIYKIMKSGGRDISLAALLLIVIYLAFISLGLPGSCSVRLACDAWNWAYLKCCGIMSMTISFGAILSSLLSGVMIEFKQRKLRLLAVS